MIAPAAPPARTPTVAPRLEMWCPRLLPMTAPAIAPATPPMTAPFLAFAWSSVCAYSGAEQRSMVSSVASVFLMGNLLRSAPFHFNGLATRRLLPSPKRPEAGPGICFAGHAGRALASRRLAQRTAIRRLIVSRFHGASPLPPRARLLRNELGAGRKGGRLRHVSLPQPRFCLRPGQARRRVSEAHGRRGVYSGGNRLRGWAADSFAGERPAGGGGRGGTLWASRSVCGGGAVG